MMHSNETIDRLLLSYQPVIGKDYERYSNHVYRIFLNCLLLDNDAANEEKYAIAAVFHDIGIWTNHSFDYLDPSAEAAKQYLIQTGRPEWIAEITSMIYWHHKITAYHGNYANTTATFRKADWIDVSLGVLHFGADRRIIKENKKRLPNCGFHLFLVKGIAANFLRHPLNPFPMFRK